MSFLIFKINNSIIPKNIAVPFFLLRTVLGMDVIQRLGGVHIRECNGVMVPQLCEHGNEAHAVAAVTQPDEAHKDATQSVNHVLQVPHVKPVTLEDQYYVARFENGRWIVRWKWIDKEPNLKNTVSCYSVSRQDQQEFDEELKRWVEQGVLLPATGESGSVIPLMAVRQEQKNKVRPVLDYRKLNEHIQCHSGTSDVCHEKIRRWRRLGRSIAVVDLKRAYLRLHVEKDLWRCQMERATVQVVSPRFRSSFSPQDHDRHCTLRFASER